MVSMELSVDDGVIVVRTDSLWASFTQKIPMFCAPGDWVDQYYAYLDGSEVASLA